MAEEEGSPETAHGAVARPTSTKADPLIFGIGCLYFGVENKRISEWEERVTETLNRLPRVSDIEVNADISHGWRATEDNTYPIEGYVEFKIEIPLPLQRQLLAKITPERLESFSIETYRVLMYYEYYGPVTFIIIDEPSATVLDSSTSVIVIREYLKKELATGTGGVAFGVVGPAPFHGDFSLGLKEQAELVMLERIPSRSYDDFLFSCSARSFASTADAAEYLFGELTDELTFFYYLKVRRNDRLHDAGEISVLTGDLIQIYEGKGVRARTRRLFTSSSKTRYLALRALTAEYDAQVKAAADVRNKDELYSSDVVPYFEHEIEDAMSEDFSGVISGARDVAGLLSEVRARQVEVTSLFMSAVAGGVAGALISLLVH